MQSLDFSIPKDLYKPIVTDIAECSQSAISIYLKDKDMQGRIITATAKSIGQSMILTKLLSQGWACRPCAILKGDAKRSQQRYMDIEDRLLERFDSIVYLKGLEVVTITGINSGEAGRLWFLWPAGHSFNTHVARTVEYLKQEATITKGCNALIQIYSKDVQEQTGGI